MFIPILIYVIYKRYPKKIIKFANLKELDKQTNTKQYRCIEKLCSKYLSIKTQPKLMYHWKGDEFATTFGTGNQMYIAVFGKFIKKYNEDADSFKSIILHEIGHIANKDVKKVYLAESTWQSLKLTLSIPIIIFVWYSIFGRNVLFLYFLIFMIILYVLRKHIIRLREFYADAKVLEWNNLQIR